MTLQKQENPDRDGGFMYLKDKKPFQFYISIGNLPILLAKIAKFVIFLLIIRPVVDSTLSSSTDLFQENEKMALKLTKFYPTSLTW